MGVLRVALKDAAEDEVNQLAQRAGWVFGGQIDATDDTPFERFWTTPDGSASIHYIEDWILDIPYVAVNAQPPDPLAEYVRAELGGYFMEDAFRMYERAATTGQLIDALYHIGAMAPPAFDLRVFDYLNRAFAHTDPEVRRGAVLAAFYTRWPEFRDALERLVNDPDPPTSRYAGTTLEKLRQYHWPAGT